MSAFIWDDSALPVIRVKWTAPPDEEADRALMGHISELFANGTVHAVVMFTNPDAGSSSHSRKRWREYLTRHRQEYANYVAGIAVVNDSGVARTVHSALAFFMRLPYAVEYVATEEQALAWCAKRLARRGISWVPPAPGATVDSAAV